MKDLSWNDRFAIIDHFKLEDGPACLLLMVSPHELRLAKGLRKDSGLFDPSTDIDFSQYETQVKLANDAFDLPENMVPSVFTTEEPKDAPTYEPKDEEPETPTPAKRRGRKTRKIKDAFDAIPYEPTPVEQFRTAHGISVSVLRRHKHFDHRPELGKVNCRLYRLHKDDTEKVLCIWRSKPENE